VIELPPLDVGAVQVITTLPPPLGAPVTPVGAPGTADVVVVVAGGALQTEIVTVEPTGTFGAPPPGFWLNTVPF
jgi:hypothetical protein